MKSTRLRAESQGDDAAFSAWYLRFPKGSKESGSAWRFRQTYDGTSIAQACFHGDSGDCETGNCYGCDHGCENVELEA